MKKAKKVVSLFLSLVILLSITAGLDLSAYAIEYEGKCGDNIVYKYDNQGNLYFEGTGRFWSPTGDFPWVSSYAIKNVVSVYISDGITEIPRNFLSGLDGSFKNLLYISIPESVINIGYRAFYFCEKLENIKIPNSVKNIESEAFCGCKSLSKIEIPGSVTEIEQSVFAHCVNLKSVIIPDSVTTISPNAFEECVELQEINVSEANKNYCSVEGVLFNKDKTDIIKYPAAKTQSKYIIPNTVEKICESAFSTTSQPGYFGYNDRADEYFGCKYLQEVIIPNSVIEVEAFAFFNCYSLTKITIPASVNYIGERVLNLCTNLLDINVSDENAYYYSKNGVLFDKYDRLIAYPIGNKQNLYTIPDTTCCIEGWAFEKSQNLKSIKLSNSIERIVYDAFSKCTALKDVYYSGTKEEWNHIYINEGNECLINATIHYGYENKEDIDLVTQHLILADLAYKIKDGDQGVKKSVSEYKGKSAIYNDSNVTKADLFNSSLVKDFKVIQVKENSATGFNGAVLVNNITKQIVFTFRGSTDCEDFLSDANFAVINKLDGQFADALKLYKEFVRTNKPFIDAGYTITFTGHSLGGALAADLAVQTGYQCYSFNGACGHTVHLSYYSDWINASKSFTGVSGIPITNYTVSRNEHFENFAFDDISIFDTTANLIQNTNSDLVYTKNYALNKNLVDPNVLYKHDLYAMTLPNEKSIMMNEILSANSPKSNWNMNINYQNIGFAMYGVAGAMVGSMFSKGGVHLGQKTNDIIKTSSINRLEQHTHVIYGGDGDDKLYGSFGNDVLVSGMGNDTLAGNFGDDIYCLTDNNATITINDSVGDDKVIISNYSGVLNKNSIEYVSNTEKYATYKIGDLNIKFQKTKTNHKLTFCNADEERVFTIDTKGNINSFGKQKAAQVYSNSLSDKESYALILDGLLTADICDSNGNIVDTVTNVDANNLESLVKDYGYIELYNDDKQMIVMYLTDLTYSIEIKGSGKLTVTAGAYDENSRLDNSKEIDVDDVSGGIEVYFENNQVLFKQNDELINSTNVVYSKAITIDSDSRVIELAKDQGLSVGYTVYPSNADISNIEYYSENPNIASVDNNGNIVGISEGSVKIYVVDQMNTVSDYITVNVKNDEHTHNYLLVVTEPTCTEMGYTTYTCNICGHAFNDNYTDIVPHTYNNGTITKVATCTESGTKTYACTVCGDSYTEIISATGHSYGEWIVDREATYTSEGSRYRGCENCNDITYDVIPKLSNINVSEDHISKPNNALISSKDNTDNKAIEKSENPIKDDSNKNIEVTSPETGNQVQISVGLSTMFILALISIVIKKIKDK